MNRHPEFRLTLSAAAWRTRIDLLEKPYEHEDDEPSLDHLYPDFHFPTLNQTRVPHPCRPQENYSPQTAEVRVGSRETEKRYRRATTSSAMCLAASNFGLRPV